MFRHESSDMRSLPSDERHALRKEVMRLRSDGLPCLQIASQTGLSRSGGIGTCKCYDALGQGGLRRARPAVRRCPPHLQTS